MKERKTLTRDQVIQISEMSKTMTNIEIGKILGIHKDTVSRWKKRLKAAGYETTTLRRKPLL